ncbi:MAG: tetratricopeptide repeat protein [Polyangiaceae bacterium]|jgi:tetratricopeptide (TPR) repeat protein
MNVGTADGTTYGKPGGLHRVGALLLALAVAGSALAVGSVHTPVLCAVAALVAVAAVTTWWSGQPVRVRPAETVLVAVAAGLVLVTGLQIVPLPSAWLSHVEPYGAAVWSRALSPLREAGPAWIPVSLDPTATRIELLKGAAYLCALLAALRVARRRGGATFLGRVVVWTGLAVAILAFAHSALGLHKLYGFYDPGPGIGERHIAPLMNPNNLAGYINLAVCLALSEALMSGHDRPRSVPAIAFVVLAAAQFWVASRAGVATMVVGALMVVGHSMSKRSGRTVRLGAVSFAVAFAAVVGAALVVLASSDQAAGELLDPDLSKAGMFGHMIKMLPSFWVFGCGRGAFESVYPAFRVDVRHLTFTHPENIVAQWLIEWGAPATCAAFVAIAVALRPRASWSRSGPVPGAWAGLVALAVQNLGDLGSEVPAVALAGVVCAAVVVGGAPGLREAHSMAWSRRPRLMACGAAACTLGSIALALGGMHGELYADRRLLHDRAVDIPVTSREMHELARAAMLRHPAEPYLPFMTALRASHERDDDGVPWIEATLERAPVYAPAHLVLARLVAARSPSQARLEYRIAMEQEPGLIGTVMAEAPRVVSGYDDATELVPRGRAADGVVEMLAAAIRQRLPATARRLDRLLESGPSPASALRAAEDAVRDIEPAHLAPWCRTADARARCAALALETSEQARALSPNTCSAHALLARARLADGSPERALAEFERAASSVDDRDLCLETVVALARGAGDAQRADRIVDQVARSGCASDARCAQTLSWVAAEQEAAGHLQQAYASCRRGKERVPENLDLLQCSARLAARAGLHSEAAHDYAQLARLRPEEGRWREAELAEQAAAIRGVVERR